MDTNKGLLAMIGEHVEESLQESNVEGRTLGKYVIGRELGSGGMGAVYEAKDNMGRTVVVKIVKFQSKDPVYREGMIKRFDREAQAAGQIDHPNVARVMSYDVIEGRQLLAMEKIDGRTLREMLLTIRAVAPKKAVEIAIGILKGLEAIHAANIVHRDLKPGNVMLTSKDDQVKILDFGLGRAIEASGNPALDVTLTQVDTPVGSPGYMSPEQTRSLPLTAGTDIYSVGVMLFQMLTGKLPFTGDTHEVFEKHRNAAFPMMVSPLGALPPGLIAIVRKAMAKTPGERHPSAAAMRKDLEAVFEPKPKVVLKAPPPARSWGLPLAAFGILAVLAVGFLLATTHVQRKDADPVAKTLAEVPSGAHKAPAPDKERGGFSIPPPPPRAATVAQGCELYQLGRTTDAITTLKSALASKPDDPDGLFCLCGAYVRVETTHDEARKACKAAQAHPTGEAEKTRQVAMWIRRIGK